MLSSPVRLINGFVTLWCQQTSHPRGLSALRVGQGTARSPGCVGWPGPGVTSPVSPQGAVLSQLLRAGAHLDGVLLEAVTVLGVTSPPRQVLANGAIVSDFSYRSDTQASALCAPRGQVPPSSVLAGSHVPTLPFPSGAESPRVAAHVGAVCDRVVLTDADLWCLAGEAEPVLFFVRPEPTRLFPRSVAPGLWLLFMLTGVNWRCVHWIFIGGA